MESKPVRNLSFSLLVAGWLYYCYKYILATSFLIDGTRYYVLFDDAMISMRYAYNLAHGLGAVWNAGEYVEGFTNPLWVGIMALIHLFPIGLNQTSLYVQILGASFLTLNLFLTRNIVEQFTDDLFAMLATVALTAFYAPLHSFGLQGMEVSLLICMLSAAVLLALKSGNTFNKWIYVLLAVSTLVRFDMAVPYLVVFAALALVQKENRKQHFVWGLGLLILFLGGQTLARYFYYGALLPNTYYLKVEGWNFTLRILRGIYAFIQFAYFSNWLLILLPFFVLTFRRDWKVGLLLLLFLGQAAYSVYVGGDAWENHGGANRYIIISIPLVFSLLAWAGVEFLKKAFLALQPVVNIAYESAWRVVFAAFFVFSLLNFNALLGEWKSIERWNLSRRPDYVAGGDYNLRIALALNKVTEPGASIAVVGAGTIPYMLPDRYAIDILGKADPYIAHQNVKTPMSIADIPLMRPGHMKWDYAHTFGQLKPDVIVSVWEGTHAEAAPYLEDYVYVAIADRVKVYLRKDSQKIIWGNLP